MTPNTAAAARNAEVAKWACKTAGAVPRFNVPLELGIHLGARLLGETPHRRKRALILESEAHRYDRTLSDISGQDIAHHGGEPARAIACVRDFFNDYRSASTPSLPGSRALVEDYDAIANDIGPRMAAEARLGSWRDLSFRDYVDVVTSSLAALAALKTS